MLSLPPSVRIFVAIEPVDMRGSFNALASHVRRLHREPLDGHLYFFLNKRKTLMKTLWWDKSGWAIWSKRLSKGSLEFPKVQAGVKQVRIDPVQLAMILEGVGLRAARRRRYSMERSTSS